jgi:hypothetical protein
MPNIGDHAMLSMEEIIALVQEQKNTAEFSLEMIACEYDKPFTAYFDSFIELEEILDENNISANPVRLHWIDASYAVSTMSELNEYLTVINHSETDLKRMAVYVEFIENHFANIDNVISFFNDNIVCEFKDFEQFGRHIAELNEIIPNDTIRQFFDFEKYGKSKEHEYSFLSGYVFN